MKDLSMIATIEPRFMIDYQNGYAAPTDAEDLQSAIAEATEQLAYTQCSVVIKTMDGTPLAISRWYSTPPDDSIGDVPLEIIGSGWYDRFTDYETGEYI